jgi:hypothetical protein
MELHVMISLTQDISKRGIIMQHVLHIESEIEKLRQKLISTGLQLGLTAPTTIQLSQELDLLLNKYQNAKINS